MVKFLPDPLNREEFDVLRQVGILPVKMNATNHNEKRLVLLGFAEESFGLLALTDDGAIRIAMGR
jgi:hypothetical protein